MKVIQPNCRTQFTAADIDFILITLGRQQDDSIALSQLLVEEQSRDLILDDPRLYRALLEHTVCLKVSEHFYFYILVRHVLLEAGLADRRMADYVAELLTEFSVQERTRCKLPGRRDSLDYFFEMLAALPQVDDYTAFLIRTHIGNQALFLSGMFPDRIRHRSERRGFPGMSYYEALGQSSFRTAGDHRLARRYELCDVFGMLAGQFHTTRIALNDMADRLMNLGEPDLPWKILLRDD